MLYYILFSIPIIFTLFYLYVAYRIISDSTDSISTEDKIFMTGGVTIIYVMLVSMGSLPSVKIWSSHASDLSKIHAQENVIEVQEERISELRSTLETMTYPNEDNLVKLNADTPVGSIVESLSDANDKLAEAKNERALAIRSVEARRIGPWSGVISFVGDYEKEG